MAIDISKRIYCAIVQNKKEGSDVVVGGWVAEIKSLGKIAFLKLRDRSGVVQLVSNNPKLIERIAKITHESVLLAEGKVKSSKLKAGGNEIELKDFELLSAADPKLPIDMSGKIKTDLSKRLDWRVLDLRQPIHSAVFKIQSKLVEGAIEWCAANDFTITFTPCLLGYPSESGSEMFEVPYFGKNAYLRQDPQLHRQLTILAGIDKLVDLGTSWRAELSFTTRHLTEHRTLALEIGFIKDEFDVMKVEEQLVAAMMKKVVQDCKEELKFFPNADFQIPKTPFPVLQFPEVYKILEKLGHKSKKIDPEAERLLSAYVKEKYRHNFFFLNRFPFEEKPFYVMRVDKEPKFARSTDLIYRGVELSSGGQREHRYDKLIENIKIKKMNPNLIEWFTQFFKYAAPPHGGFCIGIERLTMQLLGLENIREAVLFPRDPQRLTP
ncbi:MAG: aspartate--tRNA(Asn) ligase [Candidatus Nanoarchaeia archaeon]